MAGIRERLVQLTVRARDFLSGDLKPSTDAMRGLSEEGRRLKDELAEAGRARGLVRTLRDTEGATGSLERAWRDAQATLDDLTREVGDHEQATAGQRIALREARRTADEAKAAYDRSQRAIKNLRTELKGLGVDADNLGSEEDRLTAEIKQNKQAVDDNREAIKQKRIEEKKAAEAAQDHASRVGAVRGAMASGAKQVIGFAAAFVGLNALFGVAARGLDLVRGGIVSMLQTGDQFEKLGKRMASLMGSVEAGEQATAWIKDFAKSTPLEVADVAEAFALLKSYGLDPMDGTLQALVDKNEQLGGGMERLQGIASALGQAYAKQKLQTEEILQLVERGVPVWGMLEKITGKNAAQLSKLASEGRLGRDVIAALTKEIGASAEGAAAEGMGTLTGLVSNLRDTWSDFLDRVAKSGALDYAKQQLKGVADYIEQMDRDGRLDKLAKSLATAFEQGAEKVKEFIGRMAEVDLEQFIDDSAAWFSDFGAKLDDAAQRVQLFFAPFRTLFNGVTAGLSVAGAALTKFASLHLSVFEQLAKAVPDVLGGDKLRASIADAKGLLDGLTAGFVAQIEQDGKDIEAAWDTTAKSAARSAKEQTDAVRSASEQQIMLGQAAADHFVANQKRSKDAAIDAAVSGRQSIEGMAQALQLLDSASTVQQLEGLRGALLDAYQAGTISQQEYAQATGVLNGRITELQGAASGAAAGVSDLEEALGDLKSVQAAISSAKTDVDINNIRTALRKLYNDGEITASQYNQALKETSDRQKELKGTSEQLAKAQEKVSKSQEMHNEAMEDGIVTSEELRRISGQRMEEERRAGDAAMQARRKGSEEAKRDMSAVEGFFGGVLTRAREPLAGLSKAALDAYDKLRGIKSADLELDTSSLEATARSLGKVNQQLDATKAALSNPLTSSLGKWAANMQRTSLETQKAYLGQKAALQSLMERYESGQMTLAGFANAAAAAKSRLGLLDDSDLSGLESAIKSAKEQMKQLGESTRGTLESLQDELDGLEGREADIQRRRFSARQRELQAQLAEAQASGDANAVSNAARALGVLRQIEAATEQQRVREEQQKRIEADQKSVAAPVQPVTPSKIIRLEVKGQAVDVAVSDSADETKLLSLLEEAGLRSL